MSPRTPQERQERRIEIAADRISRELWDLMQDVEKAGGNGITACFGLIGSTAAALVDRCADKDVGWRYLDVVIAAAKRVQPELRAEIDAAAALDKPQGSA